MTQIRGLAVRIVTFGTIITSAIMAWKLLMCLTGCEPPLTIVVDSSMEPGYTKGDILLLGKVSSPLECGDIILFEVEVTKHLDTGDVNLLTKGDNNPKDDRNSLYMEDQQWINQKDHVLGKVIGYIPHIGSAIIFVNMHSFAMYLVMGAMSMLVLTRKSNMFG
ncbi:uncharacterized protein LOC104905135 isoform X2 [Beta vulgaris subsp. vulgaris]|uniref:uncharacterized protein LOC104905135 isoform X2 n=1 Tax=Beta vulgaris subsp. vulgaris TaxID=3555 RepID=UPI0020372F7F|nr:uncharacterized protein LOC104905135 isoform X2 [Beta vulgaris subsp. vulgaris]